MTVEEQLEAIKTKLRNGDLNLSEEEQTVIMYNHDLWQLFSDSVLNNKYDNPVPLFHILEHILFVSEHKVEGQLFHDIVVSYTRTFLQSGYYIPDLVDELFVYLQYEDDDLTKEINEILDEEIKNPMCQFTNCSADGELITKLLDAKRYDVMELLKIDFNLVPPEVITRMINECPQKGAWKELREYQYKNYLYDFDENDSFERLVEGFSYYANKLGKTEKDHELLKHIAATTRSKIEHSEDLSDVPESVILDMFSIDRDSTMFKYRHKDLLKMLIQRNCLVIAPKIFIYSKDDAGLVFDKIEQMIQENKFIPPSLFDMLNINIYENEEYLNHLIKQGEVDYLINYAKRNNCEDAFKRCIPKIINEIEEDNPKYERMLTSLSFDISSYPELSLAVLNKGKFNTLTLSLVGYSDEILDKIVEIAKKKNISIDAMSVPVIQHVLSEKLLENNCYETLSSSGLIIWLLSRPDLMLEKMDNIYFATQVVENCLILLPEYPEIINKILTNPVLVDYTIECINHNEELVDKLYNDETFKILEDHLIEKYNVNREHLEYLQKKFGSKIIMYIENENIQNILSLNDDEFNKIMAILPDVEYTMTDIEASYESLIQFRYGKENVEDISIFPLLIHAIEDNNYEEINKYRTKLIVGTKKEFIDKLVNKYNLENVKNTGDLIDLIISKSTTNDKNIYIDILHELTCEYICNSRMDYRNNHYFDEKYPKYAKVIDKILESLESGDMENVNEILFDIAGSLDKKFYMEFGKDRFLPEELRDPNILLKYVVSKVQNPDTRDNYLPVLKTIVDYYHDKNRDMNSKDISIGEELGLDYSFEEKSKKNAIVKYIILHSDIYVDKDGNFIKDRIEEELTSLGLSKDLIDDCFTFYGGSRECKNDLSLVQEKLNTFAQVANRIVRNNQICEFGRTPIDEDIIARELDKDHLIKRIYHPTKEISNSYKILSNLDIDTFRENILSNEEVYDKLVEIMHKKKLHVIPHQLEPMIDKCGISSDMSNIAAFINYFPAIIDGERKKLAATGKNPDDALVGLSSILVNADTYSCVSSVYSQILGDKDAKLIKSNPGPNEARTKTKNNERLNESIQYTIKNFTRTEVTIPTFDEIITIDDEQEPKHIEAIVGNFTDGSNLTHGERTGACMRIGGVGETLFRFILTNKNGFHIRFEDPETHEYISRVSGFRNGNTVFLNELRCSCNPNLYSDEDVVEACTKVARSLIEKSKDSTCPIENVVITKDYAMKASDKEMIPLEIITNKEGLPKFYSDINTNGIVLATTATDKPFVKIDMDKSKVPTYEPCRAKVRSSSDSNELFRKINRVASIKTLLSGVPLDQIDSMEFPDGLLCGMYTDDWYIYVDDKKEIHYDYIDVDKRAKVEVSNHLEQISELIKQTEKDNEMKGDVGYGTK